MSEIRFVGLEPRARASPEQFAALLEFMESHGDLTRPQKGAQGRLKADRLWQELGDLLNAIGGGVVKSVEKWKKVWTDWKAKTKKKALLKQSDIRGTGGGPSSKFAITAPEQRLLGIMGLNAVVGNNMIEEGGFDEPLPSPPPTQSCVFLDFPLVTEGNLEPSTIPPPSSFQSIFPPPPQITTPPPPTPLAGSPTTRAAPRRRRRPTSPTPASSPISSTRRQRRLRRIQTPFERSTAQFVEIENRRLALEELKENNNHQREMERLRLESRKQEQVQANIQMNEKVYGVLTEILAELKRK